MKIAIVGYGHVGKAMHLLFKNAIIYDKYLKIGKISEVNSAELGFICVPTPMKETGECDTTEIEEALSLITCDCIVIRSTVPIGFTDKMKDKYHKRIIFQPEYYGETMSHPFANLRNQTWLSFGGEGKDVDFAIRAYQEVITSSVKINIYPAKAVELAKYMENSFLAAKVIFCNEIYDIANALDVDYNIAREVWLSDPRIGRSHTFVYKNNRGYGGSCLPKDIASLVFQADSVQIDPTLLKAIIQKNKQYNKTEREE